MRIARVGPALQVNVDNNTVGWYQSTYLGSFLNETMIETQFTYQVGRSAVARCAVAHCSTRCGTHARSLMRAL